MTTGTTVRKTVLVTGASSGIGEGTARELAAAGHHVVLTARRADRLAEVAGGITRAGGSASTAVLDVTDPAAFRAVVDGVVAEHGRLDVLVANSGVMLLSPFTSLLTQQWDRTVDVNVKGVLHGIAAVLPHFLRQGSGHFVTTASVGAHQVSPTAGVYCATKYAVWALMEGLRLELPPSVRVTTITPGVVESELATHITDATAAAAMAEYRREAIAPAAIGRAIAYAVGEPADVDVNEVVVRPAAQRP
ncbi:SDR family oxidoreductase [Kineococcus aurantiacus]|uniref:NADP-dependent 3-hydroxy acid dehydrogenase YdfG n=1 Tax=Kineococcus aurantiacus TaxID=37633 RepID=A0A7Y9DHX8_9ACTN|nr:SDR family oxidoreductase [Kineococcus aurantiacus]NYD21836.1 NADP-dependent 3-hydroxy acid dehydrogenase YdfG [Kineococcus aurantiacus]